MTLQRNKVLQDCKPTRETFRKALSADWHRCFPREVRGTAADIMDCDKRTIGNAIAEEHLPDSFTLLMSLLADRTALQATMALFGLKLAPLVADAANDLATVAGVSHLAGQWAEALSDGERDHRETLSLADKIRPLVPALLAIVSEADRLKGAA